MGAGVMLPRMEATGNPQVRFPQSIIAIYGYKGEKLWQG
jgi:hypothetical protein